MASFNGSIDLLALNGAQLFTGIDKKNPDRAFVCAGGSERNQTDHLT